MNKKITKFFALSLAALTIISPVTYANKSKIKNFSTVHKRKKTKKMKKTKEALNTKKIIFSVIGGAIVVLGVTGIAFLIYNELIEKQSSINPVNTSCEFESVFNEYKEKYGKDKVFCCGIQNSTGYQCYFNSAIQYMLSCKKLVNFILSKGLAADKNEVQFYEEVSEKNTDQKKVQFYSKNYIVREKNKSVTYNLFKIFETMLNTPNNGCCNIKDYFITIRETLNIPEGQEDSMKMLRALIVPVFDENLINYFSWRNYYYDYTATGNDDHRVDVVDKNKMGEKNNDLGIVHSRTIIKRNNDNNLLIELLEDPDFNLPICMSNCHNINESIEKETDSLNSDNGKNQKRNVFSHCPQNLILMFNRCNNNNVKYHGEFIFYSKLVLKEFQMPKVSGPMQYPPNKDEKILLNERDIEEFTPQSEVYIDRTYKLTSVVCHKGSSASGHYIAYRLESDGNWYCFNDRVVTKIEPSNLSDVQKNYWYGTGNPGNFSAMIFNYERVS